jgi:hypothetical protein
MAALLVSAAATTAEEALEGALLVALAEGAEVAEAEAALLILRVSPELSPQLAMAEHICG